MLGGRGVGGTTDGTGSFSTVSDQQQPSAAPGSTVR